MATTSSRLGSLWGTRSNIRAIILTSWRSNGLGNWDRPCSLEGTGWGWRNSYVPKHVTYHSTRWLHSDKMKASVGIGIKKLVMKIGRGAEHEYYAGLSQQRMNIMRACHNSAWILCGPVTAVHEYYAGLSYDGYVGNPLYEKVRNRVIVILSTMFHIQLSYLLKFLLHKLNNNNKYNYVPGCW